MNEITPLIKLTAVVIVMSVAVLVFTSLILWQSPFRFIKPRLAVTALGGLIA